MFLAPGGNLPAHDLPVVEETAHHAQAVFMQLLPVVR
jgi:hypothetical protein